MILLGVATILLGALAFAFVRFGENLFTSRNPVHQPFLEKEFGFTYDTTAYEGITCAAETGISLANDPKELQKMFSSTSTADLNSSMSRYKLFHKLCSTDDAASSSPASDVRIEVGWFVRGLSYGMMMDALARRAFPEVTMSSSSPSAITTCAEDVAWGNTHQHIQKGSLFDCTFRSTASTTQSFSVFLYFGNTQQVSNYILSVGNSGESSEKAIRRIADTVVVFPAEPAENE